jgi:probable phosphoglycerate mutase
MATTIHLVRHASHAIVGSTLCGRMPGVNLSEEGRWQAEWLAQRLGREAIQALQSSPRERARQTAEPVAARLGLPLETVPALDEIDMGAWTGKRYGELEDDPDWRRWNVARSVARPPNGESAREVEARMVGHLLELGEKREGDAVVLVSHAEPIRLAVLAALGLGPDAWGRIEVAPASITTLALDPWGFRLVRLNEEPPR